MTIKFICTCGKHLKARDEMAARRSVCPRCGSPVGIPSLKPTHAGTVAAPMSPLERIQYARNRPLAPAATPSPSQDKPQPPAPRRGDPRLVRLLSTRGTRRTDLTGRHLEKHWCECLLYPLRACHLCFGLALIMMLLSALGALSLPHLFAETPTDPRLLALFYLTWGLLLVALAGLPCGFLECVLASAVAGEVYYIRWSGNALLTVLRSGAKWLACLLAGPIVFAGAGWLYWLYCGDPELLDWLILAEVGIVGVAYWIVALLAVTDRGRWRDVNPLAVADLAHRLGWRSLVVVLVAALLLLAHGVVLLAGLAAVHTLPATGLLLLVGGWVSGLFWSTFFCRLLGVWCHRSRPQATTEGEQ
jgi:hypothetical protein